VPCVSASYRCSVSRDLLLCYPCSRSRPAKLVASVKKKIKHPLRYCPDGNIYVSQNNSLDRLHSIQDAINSLPQDNSPQVILVAAGTNREQLNATRQEPLTFLRQTDDTWKGKVYSDISYNSDPKNEVQICPNAANHECSYPNNIDTRVLTVGTTYIATKGDLAQPASRFPSSFLIRQ
jgi:hypothetical protein